MDNKRNESLHPAGRNSRRGMLTWLGVSCLIALGLVGAVAFFRL